MRSRTASPAHRHDEKPIEHGVRQSDEDRALYYRQLRQTIRTVLLPELTSARATDAVGLIDRILAQFIVEEEAGAAISAAFGRDLAEAIEPGTAVAQPVVTPQQFDQLRRNAAEVVARTASSTDAAERAQSLELVEIERRYLEQVDQLRNAVLVEDSAGDDGSSPDGASVTTEQITAYLRRRLPHSPDVVVEGLSVVPGGRSKETILVSVTGSQELPDEIIVRKDRPVGLLQTRAADEFAVIRAVHDYGGVPIPEPFFAEEEDQGLGEGTFLVMERVRGTKAGEFFPDLAAPVHHRLEIGRQLAASLARLHSLPLDRLTHTGLDLDHGQVTEASVVAMVEGMVTRIGELTGPPCASVYLARQWLVEHVSDVVPASRLCLLQGDFGFHNMLIDGPQVTALVDWEGAAIGPPARELAAAWSAATSLMDWSAFLETYVDAGGPVADSDERAIAYYRVFLSLGGFMTSRTGGHLFRTGAKRDLLTAHSGLDSHFRCARNLARALADAMSSSPSSRA
jgi:aminoglycoside phosphotransferase (APT) family kinase protein